MVEKVEEGKKKKLNGWGILFSGFSRKEKKSGWEEEIQRK